MKIFLKYKIQKIIFQFKVEYYNTYISLCNRMYSSNNLAFIKKSLLEISINFNYIQEKLLKCKDFSSLTSYTDSLKSVYSCLDELKSYAS